MDSSLAAYLFGAAFAVLLALITGVRAYRSRGVPSHSVLDPSEVDPVAEAEVYLAYGRREQALQILEFAHQAMPDDVRISAAIDSIRRTGRIDLAVQPPGDLFQAICALSPEERHQVHAFIAGLAAKRGGPRLDAG